MAFRLRFTPRVKSKFRRMEKPVARRIVQKLLVLAQNAEAWPHHALKGQYKGLYRLRIGDYRAIYELKHDKELLNVIEVGHRREIYDE